MKFCLKGRFEKLTGGRPRRPFFLWIFGFAALALCHFSVQLHVSIYSTRSQSINYESLNYPNNAFVPDELDRTTTIQKVSSWNTTSVNIHPILAFRQGISSFLPPKIPVVLWPYMDAAQKGEKGNSADVTHLEVNGVEQSSILVMAKEKIRTMDPYVVWVTDAKFPYSVWCTRLAIKASKVKNLRHEHGLFANWPIFVVDFTDPPRAPKRCEKLEEVVTASNVLYFKRSIVGRHWNFTTKWLELGQPLERIGFEQTPLIVRTDIVEGLAKVSGSLSGLVNQSRPIDIAHYWPASTDIAQFSNLRNMVSTWLVENFGNDYRVVCDLVGKHDRVGRRNAQTAYIESMGQTKIIVVAQRDTYEDHYRLYEAMAAGALVLTDPMHTLPFKNGTHLLVYESLPQLMHFVAYYLIHTPERLEIARAGHREALERHRSWHRMEEIILGKQITTCNQNDSSAECPFIVNNYNA